MKLYEISALIEGLIDPETGEFTDLEALAALEMEEAKKISDIACLIKNSEAAAKAHKEEKQAQEAKQKIEENRAKRLKEFLAGYLNGAKFKDERVSISYRKSTSTEIDETMDLSRLPDEFKKVTVEANKTAIKEALQAGEVIEGCRLVEKNNLIIK